MMGQQTHTESLFYYFRFEDQIPEDHLLRLIDRHIDFSFVRKQLKEFYSLTGRPSSERASRLQHRYTDQGLVSKLLKRESPSV